VYINRPSAFGRPFSLFPWGLTLDT
jgi:hypothetical protein